MKETTLQYSSLASQHNKSTVHNEPKRTNEFIGHGSKSYSYHLTLFMKF